MSIVLSTGLAAAAIGDVGLRGALNGFILKLYAGAVPASADAALGDAVLLTTITEGGDGATLLTMEAPVGGMLSKSPDEVWTGSNVAGGSPSFYRLVKAADDGGLSTTAIRLQGTAGPNGDMLTRQVLTLGQPQAVDVYNLQLPLTAR